ncbi:MAG: hypothetical protein NTX45_02180 [Proteobacteria bacterium]|nr:hypothetical protein [Pseudomonadota bacterium]
MSAKPATARILEFHAVENPTIESITPVRGELLAVGDGGILFVRANSHEFHCDWLEGPATAGIKLEPGDRLLVVPPSDGENGVVLGRIGRYQEPKPEANVTIEAGETLTLKCGEASVDLRKDGKVMVRGEDVLLRAKGTQRIRAGTVAIN